MTLSTQTQADVSHAQLVSIAKRERMLPPSQWFLAHQDTTVKQVPLMEHRPLVLLVLTHGAMA
jgi:hypothetical protein